MQNQQEESGFRRPNTHDLGPSRIVHETILSRTDKDGVFSTVEVKKLLRGAGVNIGTINGGIFSWSDPIDGPEGWRRARLLSPRRKASDPNELPDTSSIRVSFERRPDVRISTAQENKVLNATATTEQGGTKGFFESHAARFPKTNTKGEFYLPYGAGASLTKKRREVALQQMEKLVLSLQDQKGTFRLADVIQSMANLGFNAHSVYRLARMVLNGKVPGWASERRGRGRRTFYRTTPQAQPSQLAHWIEEGRAQRAESQFDPLVTPNSYKGAKTEEMIREERSTSLSQTITDMVKAQLGSAQRDDSVSEEIARLVRERILEEVKVQLG